MKLNKMKKIQFKNSFVKYISIFIRVVLILVSSEKMIEHTNKMEKNNVKL